MTPPRQIIVVVDRVEGTIAILEADDGREFQLAPRELRPRAVEGQVYRVDLDADGSPLWKTAVADEKERDRRMKELDARMKRLRRRDPGGDIEL
jgi:hypothetical protein